MKTVMRMAFAPIDAKDFNDSYSVIAVDKPYYGYARSKHNAIVMVKAMEKYLKELQKLQQSITREFEPQLVDDSHIPANEGYCRSNACTRECNACDCLKEFRDVLYYT